MPRVPQLVNSQMAFPLLFMLVFSTGVFFIGRWLTRKAPRRACLLIAIATTALLVVNGLFLHDSLRLARVFPVADVGIYGNLTLPLAALLAGLSWKLLAAPRWQRIGVVAVLLGIGAWRTIGPVAFASAPSIAAASRWSDDVCRQSSLASCSAAAAATALRACGIDSTEAEMARLCLTSGEGTGNLGLYRGLKIKTGGTATRVRVIAATASELRMELRGPCIFSLRAQGDVSWQDKFFGSGHSVVLFGFAADGSADIGDPKSGRQRWPAQEFDSLWHGEGLELRAD